MVDFFPTGRGLGSAAETINWGRLRQALEQVVRGGFRGRLRGGFRVARAGSSASGSGQVRSEGRV